MKCNCTCNCRDGHNGHMVHGQFGEGAQDCPTTPFKMNLTVANTTNVDMTLRGHFGNTKIKAGDTWQHTFSGVPGNHEDIEIDWNAGGTGSMKPQTGQIAFSNGGGVSIIAGGLNISGDANHSISASGTVTSPGTSENFTVNGPSSSTATAPKWNSQARSCTYTANVKFEGKLPATYASGTTVENALTTASVIVQAGGVKFPPVAPGDSWNSGSNKPTITMSSQTTKGVSAGALDVTPQDGVAFAMTAAAGDVKLVVTASPTGGSPVTQTFTAISAASINIVPANGWAAGGSVDVKFEEVGQGLISGTSTKTFC